jgi:predicted nucleic acid-binding protein
MSSEHVTFDTNVMIRYQPARYPSNFLMSAVVMQELTAGAADDGEVRRLGGFWQGYESSGRLLVPNGEDWYNAGKILNALRRGIRSHKKGHTPAISPQEQQRIVRDVLIARSARRANAAVVTENVRDFEKIARFCNVKVLPPSDFF